MPQVNLSLNEIYEKLCKECQGKVVVMVRDKLTEQAIRQQLEGDRQPAKEE